MLKYFLHLSVQRISFKRKSSILSFLVLLTSFSFIIVAISIVGSISKTNTEYRLNTYGEWSFAILPANGLESWVEKQEQIQKVGKSVCSGVIRTNSGDIGIGTVDDAFLQIGRITLVDGHFPETESEIAMEADTLSALGYDYTLGQEIILFIEIPSESLTENTISQEGSSQLEPNFLMRSFTLCGVIREFHSLWNIHGTSEQQTLVSAFITPAAMETIAKELGSTPYLHLFLNVETENREYVRNSIEKTPSLFPKLFENTVAYPDNDLDARTPPPDGFYICLIGTAALIAVFSVFFLQMRESYHSFSICRSVGMTKQQLALLLALETLLLVMPAVILGALLGSVLTFLSLRLLLYSGSAPIQVEIPAGTLSVVSLLWAVCAVACRVALFFITSGTQLTGAFQLSQSKSAKLHRLTKFFIFFLTALFSTTVLFIWLGSLRPLHSLQYWPTCPAYTIYSWSEENDLFKKSDAEYIKQIPGISYVDGIIEAPVAVSFPGMNEICAWLYCLDADGWEDTFDFGDDLEAFHNGDTVLLTFMEGGIPDILPSKGTVTLHFLSSNSLDKTLPCLSADLYSNEDMAPRFLSDDGCITEKNTQVSIRAIPEDINNRLLSHIWGPYTIICSEIFLENVLSQMEPGQQWNEYIAGNEFGYSRVYVGADLTSGYLSTDMTVAKFCLENNFVLNNRRQEFLAYQQESLQELIFLLSAGGCISIISLLLLCNLLQLEAVQEERKLAILRMIGMSKKQQKLQILYQSMWTCFTSAIISTIFYAGYTVLRDIYNGNDITQLWSILTPLRFVWIFSLCVFSPFSCFLFSKMRAVKGDIDSQ